jgi:hypothetical protein
VPSDCPSCVTSDSDLPSNDQLSDHSAPRSSWKVAIAVSSSNCGFVGALVVVAEEPVVVVGPVVVVDGGVVVVVGGVVVVVVGCAIAVAAASALAKIIAEIEVPIVRKPRRAPTHTILTVSWPDVKYSLVKSIISVDLAKGRKTESWRSSPLVR